MNPLDPGQTALLADLSQLLAAAACWHNRVEGRATFEVSLASLPRDHGFVVAAGTEQVVRYLSDMRFRPEEVSFLRNLFAFHTIPAEFWDWLLEARFRGDVWAAPEGTPVFPDEPFLRLTAALPEGLIAQSYVLGIVGQQSLVATRTARMVEAAAGRPVVEAALAHGHGPAAGPLAARAAYISGAAGTTCLTAARELGIPIHGAMHAGFAAAFDGATESVERWLASYPVAATVTVGDHDPAGAARGLAGHEDVRAVRLTGDPAAAKHVRAALDEIGQSEVRIVQAGDLDEHRIGELTVADAPIDGFEVGRSLVASAAGDNLDLRYELVDIEHGGSHSPRPGGGEGHALPGVKQVWRRFGTDDLAKGDIVGLAHESHGGAPVLSQVLEGGAPSIGRPGLETIRTYAARAIGRLPSGVRRRRDPDSYDVTTSDELVALRDRLGNGVPA